MKAPKSWNHNGSLCTDDKLARENVSCLSKFSHSEHLLPKVRVIIKDNEVAQHWAPTQQLQQKLHSVYASSGLSVCRRMKKLPVHVMKGERYTVNTLS